MIFNNLTTADTAELVSSSLPTNTNQNQNQSQNQIRRLIMEKLDYFHCSKLYAVISTKCCAANKAAKTGSCRICKEPDYVQNGFIDMEKHLEDNPAKPKNLNSIYCNFKNYTYYRE
jgi:hypothetical protein